MNTVSNERMLVSVKKVFDAGIRQITREGQRVSLSNLSIEPTLPLTFVSAQNARSRGELNGLSIERLEDRPKKARVRVDLVVPLLINFTDAEGRAGSGEFNLVLPQDIVMNIPEPSIIPYAFEAIISATAPKGSFVEGYDFLLDVLITTVLKIVIDADILIPTFGYAEFPPIQNFQNLGSGYFDLPLYPSDKKTPNKP